MYARSSAQQNGGLPPICLTNPVATAPGSDTEWLRCSFATLQAVPLFTAFPLDSGGGLRWAALWREKLRWRRRVRQRRCIRQQTAALILLSLDFSNNHQGQQRRSDA